MLGGYDLGGGNRKGNVALSLIFRVISYPMPHSFFYLLSPFSFLSFRYLFFYFLLPFLALRAVKGKRECGKEKEERELLGERRMKELMS